MTTPDTAAVRAWAREQGIPVAERGRLPAELHEAYRTSAAAAKVTADHPSGGQGTAGTPSNESPMTTAQKAPAKNKTAATTRPARTTTTTRTPARKATVPAQAAPVAAETVTAPAKAPAAKRTAAPAKKAAPARVAKTAPKPVAKPAAATRTAKAEAPAATSTVEAPAAKPVDAAPAKPESVEARFIRLEERLSALTARVAELEKPQPVKPSRFRRKSS